jgi:membrane fusion protein (multidrug efflux system)
MKKSETVSGILILIAAAAGLYFLFQYKPAPEKEQDMEVVTDVPVKVGKIQQATLHGYVYAYGTVALQMPGLETPPARVEITSSNAGIITEVHCQQGGQVNKGDVLFHLDSREADLVIEKARQTMEFTKKEFERQEKLQKIQGTSDKQYEQAFELYQTALQELAIAEVARKLLDIQAPISGTIVRIDAVIGQTVNPSQLLAELQDLNRLVVSAKIPCRQIGLLKVGQKAEILVDNSSESNTGKQLFCTVSYIDSQVDPLTGTRIIHASIPEKSGLFPGQFVSCRIIYEVHENCLAVPVESVVTTPEGKACIAVVSGDRAARREIHLLLREDGLQEIQGQGLAEGMEIVTEGAYGLPDETKVRIIGR